MFGRKFNVWTSNIFNGLCKSISSIDFKGREKGRTKSEVDEIIRWLTGYTQEELEELLKKQTDYETFFKDVSNLNPSRTLIKGVVCGIRVEDIKEPMMQEIRYLDKLIDELAKGKSMNKILRVK